jgi:tRNA (mo5U34)-methyltransferase
MIGAAMAAEGSLAARVGELRWYHTLQLPGGVVTPGWFDHRAVVELVPLPASLSGLRCLDVGTFDGFWAFEMERRGAAEVVACDVRDPAEWDWPHASTAATREALVDGRVPGAAFEVARAALGSRVEHRTLSVYDLSPAEVGSFDVVYVGSLLLHLRDPVGALERVRSVCTGELVLADAVDGRLERWGRRHPRAVLDGRGRPWWWSPNAAALARMVEAAGFEVVERPRRLRIPYGAGGPAGRRGEPQAALRAR